MRVRAQMLVVLGLVVLVAAAAGYTWISRATAPTVAVVSSAAPGLSVDLFSDDELLLLQNAHRSDGARVRLANGDHVSLVSPTDTRQVSVDLQIPNGPQPIVFTRARVLDGSAAGYEGWIARADVHPVAR